MLQKQKEEDEGSIVNQTSSDGEKDKKNVQFDISERKSSHNSGRTSPVSIQTLKGLLDALKVQKVSFDIYRKVENSDDFIIVKDGKKLKLNLPFSEQSQLDDFPVKTETPTASLFKDLFKKKGTQEIDQVSFTSHSLSEEEQKEDKCVKRQDLMGKLKLGILDQIERKKQVHIGFLYASPLVIEIDPGDIKDNVAPIGFKEEFTQILSSLSDLNKSLRFKYQRATDQSLRETLNDDLIGLHFSGHGFRGDAPFIKNSRKMKTIKKGDLLLFEKLDGSGMLFFRDDFKKMLQDLKNLNLEFVVINSCHSEEIGKVFAENGSKHAICINKARQVNDKAAILFSRIFYGHVFNSKQSLCAAFKSAQGSVGKEFGVLEEKKFLLFTNNKHSAENCEKDAIRFKIEPGVISQKGAVKGICFAPPPQVTNLLRRNKVIYEVISLLKDSSLVQVYGLPGMGKSTIIRFVGNYLNERNHFADGALFVDLKSAMNFEEMVIQLYEALRDHAPQKNDQQFQFQRKQSSRSYSTGKIQNVVQNMLQRYSVDFLLILDNMDNLFRQKDLKVSNFFKDITFKLPKLRILFSASCVQPGLEGNLAILNLMPLTPQESVDLFFNKFPAQSQVFKIITWEKVKELDAYTREVNKSWQSPLKQLEGEKEPQPNELIRKYLKDHPLFVLLGGLMLSISMIASQAMIYSLKEIYEQCMKMDYQMVKSVSDQERPLLLSLEFLLQTLESQPQSKLALDIFFLVGLVPNGLHYEDLSRMFEVAIDKAMEILQTCCLVETLTDEQGGKKYKVSPFVDYFVDLKIDKVNKRELYDILAIHYEAKISEAIRAFHHQSNIKGIEECLEEHELNVLNLLSFYMLPEEEPAKPEVQEEAKGKDLHSELDFEADLQALGSPQSQPQKPDLFRDFSQAGESLTQKTSNLFQGFMSKQTSVQPNPPEKQQNSMLNTLKSFKMEKTSSLMSWFSSSKDDAASQEAQAKTNAAGADIGSIKEVAENSSSDEDIPLEKIEVEAFQQVKDLQKSLAKEKSKQLSRPMSVYQSAKKVKEVGQSSTVKTERPKSAAKTPSYPGKQNKSLKSSAKEVQGRIENLPHLPSKSAVETGGKRVSLKKAVKEKDSEDIERELFMTKALMTPQEYGRFASTKSKPKKEEKVILESSNSEEDSQNADFMLEKQEFDMMDIIENNQHKEGKSFQVMDMIQKGLGGGGEFLNKGKSKELQSAQEKSAQLFIKKFENTLKQYVVQKYNVQVSRFDKFKHVINSMKKAQASTYKEDLLKKKQVNVRGIYKLQEWEKLFCHYMMCLSVIQERNDNFQDNYRDFVLKNQNPLLKANIDLLNIRKAILAEKENLVICTMIKQLKANFQEMGCWTGETLCYYLLLQYESEEDVLKNLLVRVSDAHEDGQKRESRALVKWLEKECLLNKTNTFKLLKSLYSSDNHDTLKPPSLKKKKFESANTFIGIEKSNLQEEVEIDFDIEIDTVKPENSLLQFFDESISYKVKAILSKKKVATPSKSAKSKTIQQSKDSFSKVLEQSKVKQKDATKLGANKHRNSVNSKAKGSMNQLLKTKEEPKKPQFAKQLHNLK